VPFAALPTDSNHFLGDEFTISYLPSAVTLTEAGVCDGRKERAAGVAPSDAHLPNTIPEALSIGRIFPNTSRVVTGKAATKLFSSSWPIIMTICISPLTGA
jgi:hypothetical protein